MPTDCHHDHRMGPNKRHIPAESRPITRTRDGHSAVQLQEAPRTVQNGACGDECRPEQEWPPFVTTTMELDETKGACQRYSWQVAHVRFIPTMWLRTTNDGLNGVCGGECWPNPNDMHTDKRRPQRQTLDRISRTCTGRVAGREARRSGMLRAAHPLSSARRRRAPRWRRRPYYFAAHHVPSAPYVTEARQSSRNSLPIAVTKLGFW